MVCPSHKAEGVAVEPKKSYPAKVSRDDREVAKLFFLGCVVGLVLNLFYFKTGIGLALGLLHFMGGLMAIVIGLILESARAVWKWIEK